MTTHEPRPSSEQIFEWQGHTYDIEPIAVGAHSSAYGFEDINGKRQVLRINQESDYGFAKDAVAANHFAAPGLLIPKVTAYGQRVETGDYYAVSDRVEGKRLHDMPSAERLKTIPATLLALQTLSNAPITETGYGWWRADGSSEQTSWKQTMEHLRSLPFQEDVLAISNEFSPVLERASQVATQLLKFCPEDRQLIHGDLSSNMLFDGATLSAVIDWSHSMIGDALYDVAELDIHMQTGAIDYKKIVQSLYEATTGLPENFKERIICYQLLITISDVCWLQKVGGWTDSKRDQFSERMSSLLSQAEALQ